MEENKKILDEDNDDILCLDYANELLKSTSEETEIIIPKCLKRKLEIKIYIAIYNICLVSNEVLCKPHIKTIQNYLMGRSVAFSKYFYNKQEYGSLNYINQGMIKKILDDMIDMGIIYKESGKKDSYYIVK